MNLVTEERIWWRLDSLWKREAVNQFITKGLSGSQQLRALRPAPHCLALSASRRHTCYLRVCLLPHTCMGCIFLWGRAVPDSCLYSPKALARCLENFRHATTIDEWEHFPVSPFPSQIKTQFVVPFSNQGFSNWWILILLTVPGLRKQDIDSSHVILNHPLTPDLKTIIIVFSCF